MSQIFSNSLNRGFWDHWSHEFTACSRSVGIVLNNRAGSCGMESLDRPVLGNCGGKYCQDQSPSLMKTNNPSTASLVLHKSVDNWNRLWLDWRQKILTSRESRRNGEFLLHYAVRAQGSISDSCSRLEKCISKESVRNRVASHWPDSKFLQLRFHPHARFIIAAF